MFKRACLVLACAPLAAAATCDTLSSLNLPSTTIFIAKQVEAGAFTGPGQSFKDLPPFCRVAAAVAPVPDSDIKIEVWMPISGWNGKFVAVGNGGWSGAINYGGMAEALARGYA